jgi:hypothetical protein
LAAWSPATAWLRASDDGLERLALVRQVALRRLDQVRDQVVPARQLDIDLRKRVARGVAGRDERVVDAHGNDHDCRNDDDEHDGHEHGTSPIRD